MIWPAPPSSETLGRGHRGQMRNSLSSSAGGRAKEQTEEFDSDAVALRQLKAAVKSAVAALGQTRFVQWDIDLTRRLHLAAVPADVRDGVRRLKYIEWADELVEVSAPAVRA